MPVAQFPGNRNWGYDGVYPYAVQESYGGPAALKRLVNACHRSFSLFGLSDLKLIFDDEEENFRDRERVLERLSQVTLPAGVTPKWAPTGALSAKSTSSRYTTPILNTTLWT